MASIIDNRKKTKKAYYRKTLKHKYYYRVRLIRQKLSYTNLSCCVIICL